MGEYTTYRLEAPADHDTAIRFRLAALAYPTPDGGISPFAEDAKWGNTPSGACKWYSVWQDCLRVSSEFPDVRFTVHGVPDDDEPWFATYEGGRRVTDCQDVAGGGQA